MMNASTATEREEAKNKRLVLGAGVMLLLAAGVFSGVSSLQHQAVPMTREEQAAQDEARRQRRQADDPKKFAKALERADVLREKWRPWAQQHAGLLKMMLAAKPGDKATMLAVRDAIPMPRLKGGDGITFQDLMPDGNSGDAILSGSCFGWSMLKQRSPNHPELLADPKQQAHEELMRNRKEQRLQTDFLAFRDVSIAGASAGGRKGVCLWASGRITEGATIDNPDLKPGAPYTVTGPDKELVPPYDFLQ